MIDLDWHDLKLFYDVAETGSLAAAALRADLSPPTIGRRMVSLEKALGRKLFIRHQTGYELEADGRALLEQVREMVGTADRIGQWSSGAYRLPNVTISAGTWTTQFLARHLTQLWTPSDQFRLSFKTSEARLDIGHREADIGLRNSRPQSGHLAARKGALVAFAVYCNHSFETGLYNNWVSIAREASTTPSSVWVLSQPELWITSWVSTPSALLDVIKGGGGMGVLPCFVGDHDPELRRCGALIGELEHTSWIVMHDDERHDPAKRIVIDRMVQLFSAKAALFTGQEPII